MQFQFTIPFLFIFLLLSFKLFVPSIPFFFRSQLLWITTDTFVQTLLVLLVVSPLLAHSEFRGKVLHWFAIALSATILLDLDHFFVAHSLRLKDALWLPARPVTHSIIFALIIGLLVWVLSRHFFSGLLVAAAVASHVFYDSLDAGLTPVFWPFSIKPPKPVFVLLQFLLFFGFSRIGLGDKFHSFWYLPIHALLLKIKAPSSPKDKL